MSDELKPEELARIFHDVYELLAPQFGYTTRPETRTFDPESANGRLMIAVCATVRGALRVSPPADESVQMDARWRPISTAPKDGTRVLVCGGTFERTDELIDNRPARTTIAHWVDEQQSWWGGYVSDGVEVWYRPTHWMPLPDVPVAAMAKGD